MINARKDYDEAITFDPEKFKDPTEPVLVIRGKDNYFMEMLAHYQNLVNHDEDRWNSSDPPGSSSVEMSDGLTVFENYSETWQTENSEVMKRSDVPLGLMKNSGDYPVL